MPGSAVRVRFAPSPTGLLHVGNARTALYNWLFARQKDGAFLLRIEDTDVARSEARHEDQLLADLQWLGLNWDEGPNCAPQDYGSWRQSDRLAIYHAHALLLLAEGKAYRCFCTPEQLESERALAAAGHRPQVYSGRCRQLTAAESSARANAGDPFAIRLRIPDEPIHFHDIVHGAVTFQAADVSDPVLVRSGNAPSELGMPVYNFVVVVDDMLMRITHVIRGDDHLSNTPKQVAMYRAFGWTPPEFAHLSTILGADRARLSKRHGATSISTFREMGYLPEALVNYLALLGWAPHGGDREIFSPAELVREFSLERVTASPAVFDFDKLNWLNRHYLKEAGLARIAPLALPYFVARGWMPATLSGRDDEWFRALLALLLPAVDSLQQLPGKASLFFAYDAPTAKHAAENAEPLAAPSASAVLAQFATMLDTNPAPITAERFKAIMNDVKSATGIKGKELFHPIRIALTGSAHGPEFDKLIPLIEEGAQLGLPTPIHSVHARVAAFLAA
jgi:glutamyl-tRNA synthetase/nondiscriminating glutamyl-tRNA synthetase